MANFLELCASVALESGACNPAPSSVTITAGRQGKVVAWVARAWRAIQNISPDWSFLQGEWSGELVPDNATYTGASFNIERFCHFKGDRPSGTRTYRTTSIYDPAIGKSDETRLHEISYEAWRDTYGRGAHDSNRPTHYAIAPDGSIRFGPTPDKAYRIEGEYRKSPQSLTANGDIPAMPASLHDIIVWYAIVLMSDHDEAPNGLSTAQRKYNEMMIQMQRDCLPDIDMGGTAPIA